MEFKCPYCGNHQNVDPDFLEWNDGDIKDIDCRNCEKTYEVHGYATVDYAVEEKEHPDNGEP